MSQYRVHFGGCRFCHPPPSPTYRLFGKQCSRNIFPAEKQNLNPDLSALKFKAHAFLTLGMPPLEILFS